MKHLTRLSLLLLVVFSPAVRSLGVAAEVSAEVRGLRRTLRPLVGALTNTPVDRLEALAPNQAPAALALAWRLASADSVDPARVRRWVERAAESGDPVAQYAAGALAADSDRETEGEMLGDFETARDWWEKAAAQGHVLASMRLGDLLWGGSLETNDGAGALAVWLPVAPNRPEIERRLGLLFLAWRQGSGLFQDCDPDAARKWLSAASGHGDPAAGYALQYLTQWEQRAKAEQIPLRDWILTQVRDVTSPDFGWVLEPDGPRHPPANVVKTKSDAAKFSKELKSAEPEQAAELTRKIPKSPEEVQDPEVCFQIAELLWSGTAEIQRRPQQAIQWYLAAARAGSAPAMRRLGRLWEEGAAGQADPDEARRWYRRAEAAEKAASTPAR